MGPFGCTRCHGEITAVLALPAEAGRRREREAGGGWASWRQALPRASRATCRIVTVCVCFFFLVPFCFFLPVHPLFYGLQSVTLLAGRSRIRFQLQRRSHNFRYVDCAGTVRDIRGDMRVYGARCQRCLEIGDALSFPSQAGTLCSAAASLFPQRQSRSTPIRCQHFSLATVTLSCSDLVLGRLCSPLAA
ncbi:hypothetical protein GQ53DRAFT_399143 [Thozetella sp. PMI_491]|nr:hypothetical protein GQ53DRAFT_399143 [Thozetella sp. PMI_491]